MTANAVCDNVKIIQWKTKEKLERTINFISLASRCNY